jgi:CheY-like chemotaxis protein
MPRPLIVCIEDNEQHLRLRKAVLEKNGYDVIGVATAHEALNVLRECPVGLVLFRPHVARYNRNGTRQKAQEDKNGCAYRALLWYNSRHRETCGWLPE